MVVSSLGAYISFCSQLSFARIGLAPLFYLPGRCGSAGHRSFDLKTVRAPVVASRLAAAFSDQLEGLDVVTAAVDDIKHSMSKAFHKAAAETVPTSRAKPHRPWISSRTLQIIDDRAAARRQGDAVSENAPPPGQRLRRK